MIDHERTSKGLSAKSGRDMNRVASLLIRYILAMPAGEQRALLEELKAGNAPARRRSSRKSCFAAVQFTTRGRFFSGYITNISTAGTFIEVSGNLERLTRKGPIVLTCNHPETNADIKLKGRIVRVAENGIGIRFDHLLEDPHG